MRGYAFRQISLRLCASCHRTGSWRLRRRLRCVLRNLEATNRPCLPPFCCVSLSLRLLRFRQDLLDGVKSTLFVVSYPPHRSLGQPVATRIQLLGLARHLDQSHTSLQARVERFHPPVLLNGAASPRQSRNSVAHLHPRCTSKREDAPLRGLRRLQPSRTIALPPWGLCPHLTPSNTYAPGGLPPSNFHSERISNTNRERRIRS